MKQSLQHRINDAINHGVNLGFDLCDIDLTRETTIEQDLQPIGKPEFQDIRKKAIKENITEYVNLYIKTYKNVFLTHVTFDFIEEELKSLEKELKGLESNKNEFKEICFAREMIIFLCYNYDNDFYGIWSPNGNIQFQQFIELLCRDLEFHKYQECGDMNFTLPLNLNWIDTSNITSFGGLFYYRRFDGDVSQWNTSKVTDTDVMFAGTPFNGDLSQWDVKHVETMKGMFQCSEFNQPIATWDVTHVRTMDSMFAYSKFDQDISSWDLSHVLGMTHIFQKCLIKDEFLPQKLHDDAFSIDPDDKDRNNRKRKRKLFNLFK